MTENEQEDTIIYDNESEMKLFDAIEPPIIQSYSNATRQMFLTSKDKA